MAFRADEAAQNGLEKARRYLLGRLPTERVAESEKLLTRVLAECGPVVAAYPSWHPLVTNHNEAYPATIPGVHCGYSGLDHTTYFAHGFITCPYGDGQTVIDSVESLPDHPSAYISAERLDIPLYANSATSILVRCDWKLSLDAGHQVPKELAVPLMIEKVLPSWREAQRAETWGSMQPYFLGEPHGSRSSLFVSQETAMAMKRVYLAMIESGMFGPI